MDQHTGEDRQRPERQRSDSDLTIVRLTRDLRRAAATMSDKEARFLVDQYYIIQEDRKRSDNQVRSMADEPHETLEWYAENAGMLERYIKSALQSYAESKKVGRYLLSQYGIGPVISAGLIARIYMGEWCQVCHGHNADECDKRQKNKKLKLPAHAWTPVFSCPTVGHIWRYAGLDPTVKWEKGQKRPWDASMKTLCWHIGQSFMKFSAREECFYGRYYRQRKDYELDRNDRMLNAPLAAELLPRYNKKTEAYKHLAGGKLPPAQIDARARRWAVKLFLSHLHHVWFSMVNGCDPPWPFAMAMQGHSHYIPPPNWPFVE